QAGGGRGAHADRHRALEGRAVQAAVVVDLGAARVRAVTAAFGALQQIAARLAQARPDLEAAPAALAGGHVRLAVFAHAARALAEIVLLADAARVTRAGARGGVLGQDTAVALDAGTTAFVAADGQARAVELALVDAEHVGAGSEHERGAHEQPDAQA